MTLIGQYAVLRKNSFTEPIIAKITESAPYIWVLSKFSGVPDYAHGYTIPDILMGFCSYGSCECAYKIWSS